MTAETELAWAAGFFEGEGSLSISTSYNAKRYRCPECKGPHFSAIHLSVAQHELSRLQRFQQAVELGVVRGPYPRETSDKWVWVSRGAGEIRPVLSLLWPYFTPFTRHKLKVVLLRWENRHLVKPRRTR